MEHTWICGSAATHHKQEAIKFDASQYEFFGKSVMEHELELDDDDDSSEKAGQDHENFVSSEKHKSKDVVSSSYIDDLAISFANLSKISEPIRAKDITEKRSVSSSMERGGFNKRNTGTIKWYSNQKGYGFITPNDGGADVFVHYSSLKSDGCIHLLPGTRVEFEIIIAASNAKMQAINVTAPGSRLLQDCRKVGLGDLTTTTATTPINGPCFNCGQLGHVAKNCWLIAQGQGSSRATSTQFYHTAERESAGWSGFAWCYYCGEMGHLANNCPS